MADDETSGGGGSAEAVQRREEPDREDQAPELRAAPPSQAGYFRIYKPGQGYWTRLGTVIATTLLIVLVAQFLYSELDARTNLDVGPDGKDRFPPTMKMSIVGVFVLGAGLLAWHYLNRPGIVDFLVATESEMKKVNWTSRKELMGSTKVVILFMFLIALVLFLFDLIFGWFFYGIRVLHQPPF